MRRVLALLTAIALVATACSSDDSDATPETVIVTETSIVTETVTETSIVTEMVESEEITFWSTETSPERLAITQEIIDGFTAASGISVRLVSIDENALPSIMVSNAAAGTLPDVVFHPVDFTIGWAANGLLDTAAAAATVDALGADTFSQGALELATYEGGVAAVPSDGWGQLLIYRQDLFDAAGLDTPDTFAKIEAAAAALTDPGNDFYGITASNDASQVFTQQTFEHFALANDCQMTDDAGTVTLDSANCVEAIEFYTDLLNDYGAPATEGVVETRARYFAGKAGMIVWSPFIMDEMAGLRDAALPTCDECAADIAYLAKNSGFVPSFSGPSGSPAQYGQISNMGIGAGTNIESAQAFIEYWLSDGYLQWLTTSVEGKFPMRRGTAANPTEYIDGWRTLETGVDRKALLSEFYGDELLTTLVQGLDNFNRWGFPQGQGELVAAVYSSLPTVKELRNVLDGSKTAAEAAAEIQALVEEEQELLG